jgi:hypothetical protein
VFCMEVRKKSIYPINYLIFLDNSFLGLGIGARS